MQTFIVAQNTLIRKINRQAGYSSIKTDCLCKEIEEAGKISDLGMNRSQASHGNTTVTCFHVSSPVLWKMVR